MRLLVLLIIFITANSKIAAQTETVGPFQVGVVEIPPYCLKDPQDNWTGMAVQLWRQTAEAQQFTYELVEYPTITALNSATKSGAVDVALDPDLVLADTTDLIYLQSYHQTNLGVALPNNRSLWGTVKSLFNLAFLKIVLSLSVLLIIIGTAMYFLERKENEEHFGGDRTTAEGIGSGFWWAGVTLTTIGYGDKAPTSFAGRALAMLWMLVGLAVTASLTAALVAAAEGKSTLNFPEELRDKQVGLVEGAVAEDLLQEKSVAYQTFPTVQVGLQALNDKSINALVHDATSLRYVIAQNSALDATVQATKNRPRAWCFAVPKDSPLVGQLNRDVLRIVVSESWQETLKRYTE